MKILDEIFTFSLDPKSTENNMIKQVTLKPDLTDKLVNSLLFDTQKAILELYKSCEEHFTKGLQIYEAIVKKRILLTTQSQIEQLHKSIEEPKLQVDEPKLPVEEPKPQVDEPKPPVEEPKLQVDEPKPPIEKPKPPIEKPKPPVEEPKPPIEKPKPPVEEQKPPN